MAVAEEILAYCGRCKLDSMHIIVAHKGDNTSPIAKVQCKTCYAIHGYRKAGTTSAKKSKTVQSAVPVEVEWKRQLAEAKEKGSQVYAIDGSYIVGDVVKHPVFGLGVVQTLKSRDKMEVLFQSDIKLLACNK